MKRRQNKGRSTSYAGQMVSAYPLHWPAGKPRTPEQNRERARFGGRSQVSVHAATRRLLEQINKMTRRGQVWRVDPDLVVVSTNVELRADGLPMSVRRAPEDPGVAVYFEIDGEPHCLPCDRWDRVADNIVAVAKHVEAMRGMERWGVGDLRTAFAGFKALPGGNAVQPAMTPEDAARWMNVQGCGFASEDLLQTPDYVKAAYRQLAKTLHPDAGRSEGQFEMLSEAKRVLDEYHGGEA